MKIPPHYIKSPKTSAKFRCYFWWMWKTRHTQKNGWAKLWTTAIFFGPFVSGWRFFRQEGRERSAHQVLHRALLPSWGWRFTTHSATELCFLPWFLAMAEDGDYKTTRSPQGLTRLLLMPQQKYRPFSFLTRTWRRLLRAPRYELADSICDLCSANPAPPLPVPGPQDSWALVTGPSRNRVYSKRAPHSRESLEKSVQ